MHTETKEHIEHLLMLAMLARDKKQSDAEQLHRKFVAACQKAFKDKHLTEEELNETIAHTIEQHERRRRCPR